MGAQTDAKHDDTDLPVALNSDERMDSGGERCRRYNTTLLFRCLQPLFFQVDNSGCDAFDMVFDFCCGPFAIPLGEGLVHFGMALLVIEM
jgi:hypothetical protein